jgi:hypothetical protein
MFFGTIVSRGCEMRSSDTLAVALSYCSSSSSFRHIYHSVLAPNDGRTAVFCEFCLMHTSFSARSMLHGHPAACLSRMPQGHPAHALTPIQPYVCPPAYGWQPGLLPQTTGRAAHSTLRRNFNRAHHAPRRAGRSAVRPASGHHMSGSTRGSCLRICWGCPRHCG